MFRWFKAHFHRHCQRPAWEFCWKVSIESVVVSMIFGAILTMAVAEPEREILSWPAAQIIVMVLIAAPIIETLFLQVIPVSIAKLFRAGLKMQIFVSMAIFALPHFYEGISVGVSAGLVGGFYFAFAYAHWARKSFWKALWVTSAAHLIHNVIPAFIIILARIFEVYPQQGVCQTGAW